MQHPDRQYAAAPKPINGALPDERDPPGHALGVVPHQIRGFLATFKNLMIRGESYPNCSACSKPILDAYKKDGYHFVRKALDDKDYVAELSGLAEIQRRAEQLEADIESSDGEGGDDEEAVLL